MRRPSSHHQYSVLPRLDLYAAPVEQPVGPRTYSVADVAALVGNIHKSTLYHEVQDFGTVLGIPVHRHPHTRRITVSRKLVHEYLDRLDQS